MTVTVALLKAQLNLTGTDDDALLAHKIAAATAWCEQYIGQSFADIDPLPATLDEAVLQLAAHWYENREAVLVGASSAEVPFGVRDLIKPYVDWSDPEHEEAA
jgi:uncharacterized phage protein (predicted DNA packaging)